MYICICNALTDTQVTRAIEKGCRAPQTCTKPVAPNHNAGVAWKPCQICWTGQWEKLSSARRVNFAPGPHPRICQFVPADNFAGLFFQSGPAGSQPVNMLFRVVQNFHENIAGAIN